MNPPTVRPSRSPSAGLRALLFILGVLVLFPLMLEPAAALSSRGLLLSQSAETAALNWGVFLAVLVPTTVAARLERRPFGDYGYPRRGAGARFSEGCVWGVTMASLAAVILRLTGAVDFDSVGLHAAAAMVSGIVWWFSRLGFAAMNQLMWRGYLQVTAARGMGFWPAASVMAVFFTVEKLLGTQYRHPLPIVAFLGWGLLCALVLRRTGSLWFGTGLELGLDWGMIFLYGLATQGASAHPPGALVNATTYNSLFTGGPGGMRASVVMPVLTALAAVLALARFPLPGPAATASPEQVT